MAIITPLETDPKVVGVICSYDRGEGELEFSGSQGLEEALDMLTAPLIRGGLTRVVLGRIDTRRIPATTGLLSGEYYPPRDMEVVVQDHKNPTGVYAESVPL